MTRITNVPARSLTPDGANRPSPLGSPLAYELFDLKADRKQEAVPPLLGSSFYRRTQRPVAPEGFQFPGTRNALRYGEFVALAHRSEPGAPRNGNNRSDCLHPRAMIYIFNLSYQRDEALSTCARGVVLRLC